MGSKVFPLNKVWIFCLAVSISLSAGMAAKGEVIPSACAEYSQFLASSESMPITDQLEASECIPYEILVMSATGWRSFVWNFERNFSKDGYPARVYGALKASKDGNGGLAILRLDAASSSMHQVFAKTRDRERGTAYIYLLTRLRNRILREYVSDQNFLTELSGIEKPQVLSSQIISDDRVEVYLVCLIQLDAWTEQFSKLIRSKAFKNCI